MWNIGVATLYSQTAGSILWVAGFLSSPLHLPSCLSSRIHARGPGPAGSCSPASRSLLAFSGVGERLGALHVGFFSYLSLIVSPSRLHWSLW